MMQNVIWFMVAALIFIAILILFFAATADVSEYSRKMEDEAQEQYLKEWLLKKKLKKK